MADETEAPAEKKGGGNGMMIVLIVLIVLLLAAVGGLGYFLYSKGIFDPQKKEEVSEASTQQKVESSTKEEEGETFRAKIESLVLNITDAKGRAKLMKLSFELKAIEPTIESVVEANKAEIIDAVIRQVSARSSEELLTVGGKAMLKEEMIEEINNILNDATDEEEIKRDSVKNIFFTTFVIK